MTRRVLFAVLATVAVVTAVFVILIGMWLGPGGGKP